MSRHFEQDGQYVQGVGSPVGGFPASMSAWVRADSHADNQTVVDLGVSGGSDRFRIFKVGTTGQIISNLFTTAASNAVTSGATVIDQWAHVGGTATSANVRAVLNGIPTADTSHSRAWPAGNMVTVGRTTSSASQDFDGFIAVVGIWDADLTPAEWYDLGVRRFAPPLVRFGSLVWWKSFRFPDFNFGPIGQRLTTKHRLTNTGTTFSMRKPPGIIYPRERIVVPTEQAAAAAGHDYLAAVHRRRSHRLMTGAI